MPNPTQESAEEPLPTKKFFDAMLPAIIAQRADFFDATFGTVCIMVHEVGQWTVCFGDHSSLDALTDEADFDADLLLTWTDPQFQALLGGRSHDAKEIEPIFMGDISLLEKFGALLVPPAKGGLGARMWGI